jgi:large subunit ribosomal protein L5e
MAFIKAVKTNAYFKRFQTKYRRRREGKTDYNQRRKLVKQEKSKYNTPKYRFVVRRTNTQVICQVIYATIQGDRVVAQASSKELHKYGIKTGLKNYAAAYTTGLLVARRLLKSVGLDSAYVGKKEATGDEFHVADEIQGERKPFKAVLDVGLVRTTIGARVFGALKGATDGGLDIPHNTKRFPGYKPAEGKTEGAYDPKLHKDRIMGKHVANYMKHLQEEDPESYERQFSQYVKAGLTSDKVEALYKKAHASIRSDPSFKKKASRGVKNTRVGNTIKSSSGKSYIRNAKLNNKQRKARVLEKIRNAQTKALAAAAAQ